MIEKENIETKQEDNNSLLEMFIIIIFIVSLLGGGLKVYNSAQKVPSYKWGGPCELAGMTDEERIDCLKKEKNNKNKAEIFLLENKQTFMFVGIICLLGSIIILGQVKKYKLKGGYIFLGIISIILSIVLLV